MGVGPEKVKDAIRVLLCAGVIAVALSPSLARAQGQEKCMGRRATIVSGQDQVWGTRGDDVIVATEGHQDVFALDGDDVVCGPGGGFLLGGDGDDRLRQGDGGVADGGAGRDFLISQRGTLKGGAGHDRILCGRGRVRAGPGNDRIVVTDFCVMSEGPGDDVMRAPELGASGGASHVIYRGAPGPVHVDLGKGMATGWGNDVIRGVRGVEGSPHDDVLVGGPSDDRLDGGPGRDRLQGGGGRDALFGDEHGDVLEGGLGNDILRASNHPKEESWPERLLGGRDDDTLQAGAGDDAFVGGPGSDTLEHGAVSATVEVNLPAHSSTGDGNDTLRGVENVYVGGRGSTIVGDDKDNILFVGHEDGTVDGGDGDDTITFDYGAGYRFDAGAGRDTLDLELTGESFTVDLSGGTVTAADGERAQIAGFEVVIGSGAADRLFGSEESDVLIGGDGPDELQGRAGDDEILGEKGNDVIDGGDGADRVIGGMADDELHGAGGDDYLDGKLGVDTLDGGDGIDDCLNGEVLIFCESPPTGLNDLRVSNR